MAGLIEAAGLGKELSARETDAGINRVFGGKTEGGFDGGVEFCFGTVILAEGNEGGGGRFVCDDKVGLGGVGALGIVAGKGVVVLATMEFGKVVVGHGNGAGGFKRGLLEVETSGVEVVLLKGEGTKDIMGKGEVEVGL